LPRLTAAIEYRGNQATEVILHAAIGRHRRFNGALFFVVVDHKADVVFGRLTLLRGHCTHSRGCRSGDHAGAMDNRR